MSVVSRGGALLASALLLLAACATEPVPDFRYFRFGEAAAVSRLPTAPLALPLVVEPFRADGVMGERPILYATRDETVRLSQYHYQLWNDPPPVLVRQRLLDQLAAAAVAPLVTERLSPRVEAFRLQGRIEEFQRVRGADGDQVVVSVWLRLERDQVGMPLIERRYRKQLTVSGEGIEAAALAFGQAVDALVGDLLGDLSALPAELRRGKDAAGA
jgi:cholesterol transport system auxiliary component